ncbi:Spore protein SP21 [Planctomycetes bacterium Pan216]|uniref:Spore protein SP21 n=1 Tax=Kolteria novifilia TaxID=2527975 RepID=A0A518AXG2_9BACT|nr:Spore protein SP21 [Planctomycetes bacterium Pan216]
MAKPRVRKQRESDLPPAEEPSHSLLHRLRDEFNSVFDRLTGGQWNMYPVYSDILNDEYEPVVEIAETDKDIVLTMEIPGVDVKSLDVAVADTSVKIRGEKNQSSAGEECEIHHCERQYGKFNRVVTLPVAIDADQVKAKYGHGILTVRLAKLKATHKKKVPIDIE